MAGQADRLLADPLHQAAVAGDRIGVVVDHLVPETRRQHPLRQRHPHGVGQALAQRAGGGLDPGAVPEFRMAGRRLAELAEFLEALQREILVTRQMQQRIQQHRAMPGREHETVAIGPGRIFRVEAQMVVEKNRGDVGHAHRHAGMTGFRGLDRIHGERSDRARHFPKIRMGGLLVGASLQIVVSH